jgi:hypothetical protein
VLAVVPAMTSGAMGLSGLPICLAGARRGRSSGVRAGAVGAVVARAAVPAQRVMLSRSTGLAPR